MKNSWSCSIDAVSIATGISSDVLIKEIGHDGSERAFPSLPIPMCYRGFNFEEIKLALLKLGFMMLSFELNPRSTPNGTDIFEVYTETQKLELVETLTKAFNGVFVGPRKTREIWHCNAWIRDKGLFDSTGRKLTEPNINAHTFHVITEFQLSSLIKFLS